MEKLKNEPSRDKPQGIKLASPASKSLSYDNALLKAHYYSEAVASLGRRQAVESLAVRGTAELESEEIQTGLVYF